METIYLVIDTQSGRLTIDGPLFNLRQLVEALQIKTAPGVSPPRDTAPSAVIAPDPRGPERAGVSHDAT
jgi:hypothetical protein